MSLFALDNVTTEVFPAADHFEQTTLVNILGGEFTPVLAPLVAASEWIDIVFRPIIVLVGLLGNSASFLVMMSPSLRNRSTSVYFSTLAVADNLCLLQLIGQYLVKRAFLTSYLRLSDVVCKIERFVMLFTFQWSAWLIVCVTVERFIVTCFPFRAKTLCTAKIARMVVVGITLFSSTLWLAIVFADGVTSGTCDLTLFYIRFFTWGMWLATILYSYIPTVLLLVFNVTIAVLLIKSARMSSGQKDQTLTRATKATLSVSVSYLLLTIPTVTFITINFTGGVKMSRDVYILVNMVMNSLLWVNHAINFFIYVLMSKSFRAAFTNACCACVKGSAYVSGQSGTNMATPGSQSDSEMKRGTTVSNLDSGNSSIAA